MKHPLQRLDMPPDPSQPISLVPLMHGLGTRTGSGMMKALAEQHG